MKKGVLVSVFLIFMCSCEAENIDEESFTGETLIEDLGPGEYLYLSLNGEKHEIVDSVNLSAQVQTNQDSAVISFVMNGELPPENELIFNLVVCFYDGPGIYYTGTGDDLSGSILNLQGYEWFCNRTTRDPGIVMIKKADEEYIEGSFKIRGFNPELKNYVLQKGDFRVKWEKFTN